MAHTEQHKRSAQALPLAKALVEPVRIRIYLLLKQAALTVSELSEVLELSQSNTSHHIKALRDLGFLSAAKTGQHTYYALNSETLEHKRVQNLVAILSDLASEIGETQSDATKLKSVLAARGEETFAEWRLEQPDLPYSDIFAHLAAGRYGRVYDIGCGEGDFFESLALSFDEVVGYDIEKSHVERANERAKRLGNVRAEVADAAKLPAKNQSADAVVLRMALSQMRSPLAALDEALRVLKDGGYLSIIDRESISEKHFHDAISLHLKTKNQCAIEYERALPRLFILRARRLARHKSS